MGVTPGFRAATTTAGWMRRIARRYGMLRRGSSPVPAFPTFDGGEVLVPAAKMKSIIHGDEVG